MNPNGLVFNYLKSKGTILSLIGDLIIFSGVVFFNWNALRAIGFICLDVEIMVILFIIFMNIEEPISGALIKLGGIIIFSSLLLGFFATVLELQEYFGVRMTQHKIISDTARLFYPYYDISLFATLSTFAHLDTIIRLRKVPESMDKYKFQVKAVFFRMLMIPATLIVGGYMALILGLNTYTVPLLAFLAVKEILEYWKFKSLTGLHDKAADL